MNSAITPAPPIGIPRFGLANLLAPSLSDLLFIALLVWLLVFTISGSPTGLLQDAGTGVHIRTGDWILAHNAVPVADPFSFSKPGQPWFAWEWLSDVAFSGLNRVWGLKGIIVFSAALLSLVCWLSVRHMALAGANALAALFVMHAAIGAGSVHFLARPHIFTLIFLVYAFYLLDRDRQTESGAVWLLVPLTAVWANMHGGFTGMIATLAALAAGSVLELNWHKVVRYGSLAASCLGASLLNPYGYHLHEHVVEYLQADWIRKIVLEFQPPVLGTAPGAYFEVTLFLGVAMAGWLAYQKRFGEMAVILLWAHAAMTSVRHVPIFAFLVAPYLALEVTRLMKLAADGSGAKSVPAILNQMGEEHQKGLLRSSIAGPAFVVLLFAFNLGLNYPTDFPSLKYPVEALNKHGDLIRASRIYAPDAWGDYLIYRDYQKQKVFFDGRTDYYGEALTHEYQILLNGFPGWDGVMKKYSINAVLVPPDSPLVMLLKDNRDWQPVDQTADYVLVKRTL